MQLRNGNISLPQKLGRISPKKDPPAVGYGIMGFPLSLLGSRVYHGHKMSITRMVWESFLPFRLKMGVLSCKRAFPKLLPLSVPTLNHQDLVSNLYFKESK